MGGGSHRAGGGIWIVLLRRRLKRMRREARRSKDKLTGLSGAEGYVVKREDAF